MRCRIQSESYQEESRLKVRGLKLTRTRTRTRTRTLTLTQTLPLPLTLQVSCLKLDPSDYLAEGRALLQDIATMQR